MISVRSYFVFNVTLLLLAFVVVLWQAENPN